jgi:cell pole-organizing protein PopZ
MEEILASIRRIIADDQDSTRPPDPDAAEASPSPSTRPAAMRDNGLDRSEPRSPGARVVELEHEDDSPSDEDEAIEVASALSDDGEDPEPAAPRRPPAAAPAWREPPRPESLLSPAAQSTAANAFQRLSTTVLSSHPRTLEDLVTDLLRPMLKAWLDENLPPLVERLVRAEIERVARGGR